MKSLQIFFFLFLFSQCCYADFYPSYTVGAMCHTSKAIVEGQYIGNGQVRIDLAYQPNELVGSIISIKDFDKYVKPNGMRKLLLFLDRITVDGHTIYVPISPYPATGGNFFHTDGDSLGSNGIFWFDDKHCMTYYQAMNPGSLRLFNCTHPDNYEITYTMEMIRADIKTGMKESKYFEKSMAIRDPLQKMKELSKYLLKATSPCPNNYRYYCAQISFLDIWEEEKYFFTPILTDVLEKADTSENVAEIVRIFANHGGKHTTGAVAALCRILAGPEGRAPKEWVIGAIEKTGSSAAIPSIRIELNNKEWYNRVSAAIALCYLGDHASYDQLKNILSVNHKDWYDGQYLDQLEALYYLEPERSYSLIKDLGDKYDNKYQASNISDILK